MRWTTRHTLVFLLTLTLALGLGLLLFWPQRAEAEPVGVTPLPPVEETDGRAGACYSFYYDPPEGPNRPFIPLALDAGSRWDRFDFVWPNIEPADNAWSFGAYDALVNDMDAAGMDMIGILLWTPDWAATSGATGRPVPSLDQRPPGWYAPTARQVLAPVEASAWSSPPQGLYLAWDDPNNHWGDFCYTVVDRFKDRVQHWEIWNEPEWTHFWTGTSADYAQLVKVGYQATKAACPDCTVLFGGLHYWKNPGYYRSVLSTLDGDPDASQNNHFFDVMSVHFYSSVSNTYDKINEIRDGMNIHNVGDHPIWLTETGVPVWDDGLVDPDATKYDYAGTQEEAAAYVIQSYANAWASDVGRYLFFRTHDADMSEYFGLIRNDHSLRPAYVAYQVAATHLVSPTFVTRELTGSHRNVTLWGTPRGKVSVLWNEGPTTSVYTLPAAIPTATFVDRWGMTRTVTATDLLVGTPAYWIYTATLPGATANLASSPNDYFIGGEPLIVIETETPAQSPTSTVHPLPEVTFTSAFTVTWEGKDNQAGIRFFDIQVRDGAGGEWVDWQPMTVDTSGQFVGEHNHTYYFRSRATDQVGNRTPWPEQPQARTRVDFLSELWFEIGSLFADENRNGVRDKTITGTGTMTPAGEITLTNVALRFVDGSGADVVTPTVGGAWAFTTTVSAEQTYVLRAISADHMRLLWFRWPSGERMVTVTYPALGLWRVSRVYLPLILRLAS